MSNRKRKYKRVRAEFKEELTLEMSENLSLAMLVLLTYTAKKHKNHILEIWGMFKNPEYENFEKDYKDHLMGKHLTGRVDIWRSFYFSQYLNLYEYKYEIPEKLAMGDALAVAYRVLKYK